MLSKFRFRTHGLIIVKSFVTVSLIVVLLSKAHWPTVFDQVQHIGAPLIVATLVILFLSVTISAYKWKLFLSIHDLDFDFRTLHRYYFIAMYINNFLPTTIGGDGYRIYKTFGKDGSKSSALIAVFMERVTGLTALLILAYISAMYLFAVTDDGIAIIFLVTGAGACVAVTIAYFIFPARYFRRLKDRFNGLAKIVDSLLSHINDYITHRKLVVKVVIISFLFHFHLALAYVVLLNFGLNLSVPIYELFIVLAVIGIVGVLPISINGIGVVEGTFVLLMGHYGVEYENALMVSFLMRILVLPISLFGALLFVLGENNLASLSKSPPQSAPIDQTRTDHQ